MANSTNIENALSYLLIESQQDEGQAIALVGEWGIGKTYLWNEFYKKK